MTIANVIDEVANISRASESYEPVLMDISAEFDSHYSIECAACLIAFREAYPYATLAYRRNDEWASISINGIRIWLRKNYYDGRTRPGEEMIFEIEVTFFKSLDGDNQIIFCHDVSRSILEIQELYFSFFNINKTQIVRDAPSQMALL